MKFLVAFVALCGAFAAAAVIRPADPLITIILQNANLNSKVDVTLKFWVISTDVKLTLPITQSQIFSMHHFMEVRFSSVEKPIQTANPQFSRTYKVPQSIESSSPIPQYNDHSFVVFEMWNATHSNEFIGGAIMTVEQLKKGPENLTVQLVDAQHSQPTGKLHIVVLQN